MFSVVCKIFHMFDESIDFYLNPIHTKFCVLFFLYVLFFGFAMIIIFNLTSRSDLLNLQQDRFNVQVYWKSAGGAVPAVAQLASSSYYAAFSSSSPSLPPPSQDDKIQKSRTSSTI